MGRPLDVVLAMVCDRKKLVADVEDIARDNNLHRMSAWELLTEQPDVSGWMLIVAEEEMQKLSDITNRQMDLINSL